MTASSQIKSFQGLLDDVHAFHHLEVNYYRLERFRVAYKRFIHNSEHVYQLFCVLDPDYFVNALFTLRPLLSRILSNEVYLIELLERLSVKPDYLKQFVESNLFDLLLSGITLEQYMAFVYKCPANVWPLLVKKKIFDEVIGEVIYEKDLFLLKMAGDDSFFDLFNLLGSVHKGELIVNFPALLKAPKVDAQHTLAALLQGSELYTKSKNHLSQTAFVLLGDKFFKWESKAVVRMLSGFLASKRANCIEFLAQQDKHLLSQIRLETTVIYQQIQQAESNYRKYGDCYKKLKKSEYEIADESKNLFNLSLAAIIIGYISVYTAIVVPILFFTLMPIAPVVCICLAATLIATVPVWFAVSKFCVYQASRYQKQAVALEKELGNTEEIEALYQILDKMNLPPLSKPEPAINNLSDHWFCGFFNTTKTHNESNEEQGQCALTLSSASWRQ